MGKDCCKPIKRCTCSKKYKKDKKCKKEKKHRKHHHKKCYDSSRIEFCSHVNKLYCPSVCNYATEKARERIGVNISLLEKKSNSID